MKQKVRAGGEVCGKISLDLRARGGGRPSSNLGLHDFLSRFETGFEGLRSEPTRQNIRKYSFHLSLVFTRHFST